jgi:type III pantothenate kinase
MILTLDVGNTQIHGGVFKEDEIALQFRKTSRQQFSSDEVGIFLRSVLRENNIDPFTIKQISICSVVPEVVHSLRNGCIKYFEIDPFILKAGVKTGLKIKYRNPLEVGTDRIANAIAGSHIYPGKNLIVVDFGTATTFDVITKGKEYLGGVIIPGIRISMESLVKETAKLPSVEITEVTEVVGRSTADSIRSGLYFGHIGIVKEITKRITKESFSAGKPLVIATGGFSRLFENTDLFDEIIVDLVLKGLYQALKLNTN